MALHWADRGAGRRQPDARRLDGSAAALAAQAVSGTCGTSGSASPCFVVTCARLAWRARHRPPPRAPMPDWQRRAATASHVLLYVLLAHHPAFGLAVQLVDRRAGRLPGPLPAAGPRAEGPGVGHGTEVDPFRNELDAFRVGLYSCRGGALASLRRPGHDTRPHAAEGVDERRPPMTARWLALLCPRDAAARRGAPAGAQEVLVRQERDPLRREATGRQRGGALPEVEGQRGVPAGGSREVEGANSTSTSPASISRARIRRGKSGTGCGSTRRSSRSRIFPRRRSAIWAATNTRSPARSR